MQLSRKPHYNVDEQLQSLEADDTERRPQSAELDQDVRLGQVDRGMRHGITEGEATGEHDLPGRIN